MYDILDMIQCRTHLFTEADGQKVFAVNLAAVLLCVHALLRLLLIQLNKSSHCSG